METSATPSSPPAKGQSSSAAVAAPTSVETEAMEEDTKHQPPADSASPRNGSSSSNGNLMKCVKCHKRVAREGCTQTACLNCCDDVEGCETHRKPRAQALMKEQILAGTTEVQRLAAAKRRMRIPDTGRFFREPGFVYQGDTVVIWDLRAYADHPKWRDEAVRKAMRRQKARQHHRLEGSAVVQNPLRNSRKRFHRIVQERYLASQKSSC